MKIPVTLGSATSTAVQQLKIENDNNASGFLYNQQSGEQ